MGFSLKKIGKNLLKTVEQNALPAVGATIGSFAGNPALGYQIGNMVNGAVGLGASSADGIGATYDANLNSQNLAMQKELAQYNADQQMRINKATHEQNLQMWNLQNAYNSPEAQMKRYEEAGLNPNLIYDQQNTASGVPMLESPRFDTGPYNPVDTRVQREQLALAIQEHKLQIQNQAIENDMKRQQLSLSARAADREDRLADAQIKNLASSLGLRYAEFDWDKNKPVTWLGRYAFDTGKAINVLSSKAAKPTEKQQTSFVSNRVKSYNASKGKYKKGFNK